MNIVAELKKIASLLDDGQQTTWKIENIDIWGPSDFDSFETDRFSTKREIGKACIDYLVEQHPDWRGQIHAKWFGEDIFHILDKEGQSLLEVKKAED